MFSCIYISWYWGAVIWTRLPYRLQPRAPQDPAKILSNHYSSLFKERICNKFTSSYVTSKKYSRLVQVVYGVASSEGRGGGTIALASRSQKVMTRPWSCSYGCWTYNYLYNQCLSPLKLWVRITPRRCVLDTTLCNKVTTYRWFSPVFSTNKTDCHDITEILLKVALNTINVITLYVPDVMKY